jgi:phage terminase large subunit
MATVEVDFPDKLAFLFRPMRYKVARGGRGSGKSWGFARALLVLGVEMPLRILCAREIQRSIRDSVHQLLKDQIKLMGLESEYSVGEQIIEGRHVDTRFIFSGLSNQTIDSIKSFEGIDVVWVEEGQRCSARSWRILIPTIRKEGSEIWVTYNPDLDTDATHQRFFIKKPADCINVLMNWRDNPWFNETLNRERLHCAKYEPDDYPNVWEGETRPAVEGAIYYKQLDEAQRQGRIRPVPYDAMLLVHVVIDLGWEDSLAAALVQRVTSEIRIIEYVEVHHTTLDIFSAELRLRPYNWGKVWLPHDGFSKQLNSGGKSTKDLLKKQGWRVASRKQITELSIDEGIRATRLAFPRMYFDVDKCAADEAPKCTFPQATATDLNNRLVECCKRYRRHISVQTEAPMTPVKDQYAHGADTLRYVAINADKMTNEIYDPAAIIGTVPSYQPSDPGAGY